MLTMKSEFYLLGSLLLIITCWGREESVLFRERKKKRKEKIKGEKNSLLIGNIRKKL